jgi:hypothetical protein
MPVASITDVPMPRPSDSTAAGTIRALLEEAL